MLRNIRQSTLGTAFLIYCAFNLEQLAMKILKTQL